ncbi:GTP-binding protein A [Echria macrotheca]|uniref:GTP-binding protein A n=1 Tax=Echria macrotheca TaxID=438768 RepID=A0AAJ0BC22_9PEZI|nr:GTP-binding protein A [Echria macrotheca]
MDPVHPPASSPRKERRILIALCGVTGAGKTTFVAKASGRKDLKIGYDVDPCTQEPQMVEFKLECKKDDNDPSDEREIVLIDTPGFDDDTRSDVEILELIAAWMAKRDMMKEQLLDGLIFLHPITHNRVGGSEWNRTRLLEKILGRHAYKRVIIATTMWDDLSNPEAAEKRVEGRTRAGGVWYEMKSKGAQVLKHKNNAQSAHSIIRNIVYKADKYGKMEPLLHTELKKYKGRVVRTSAGKELRRQLEEAIDQIRKDLDALEENCPKVDEDTSKRANPEYVAWRKEVRELEKRLHLKEQQLKRLNGLTVRIIKRLLSTLFGM